MQVVIEDVTTHIYRNGRLTQVTITVQVDTDRLSDAARRADNNVDGTATWSNGAFKVYLHDMGRGDEQAG